MSLASSRRVWRRASGRRALLGLFALLAAVAALHGPRAAFGRDLAIDLQMRYLHQYLGNASDNHDCGPTAVAMILDAYNLRPAGLSDSRFVASIRRTMGLPNDIGTIFDDLERAFSAYGLRYSLVPSSLPGEPEAEYQMMRDAIDAGNLVIPLLHGAVLGRGEAYGDHWPVLVGASSDSVHLLDPDDQPARNSSWVRGGDVTLPVALFKQATLKAQPGPYGLIVYPPGRRPSAPLQVGGQAQISGTDGDGAWLRSSPALGDNKLALLAEGTVVTIVGPLPPPSAAGHEWIGVSVNGQQGYVAAEYVAP